MEKKIKSLEICIAMLTIALVWSISRINSLQSDVKLLERELDQQVRNLEDRVNSIYGNVDEFLKQEASLISGVEYTYGELNTSTSKVDVHISVTPKQVSDDLTVHASFDGESVELIPEGNVFSGTVPVGLFAEDEQILLTLESAGGTQTEYLQDVHVTQLFPQYIPYFYDCDISGKNTFYPSGKYIMDGTLNINCSPVEETPNVRFISFCLVTELNGKEIEREDISESVFNYETYPNGVYFRDDYQREFAVTEGDELIIWLDAEDSLGYRHRCLLHRWKKQGNAVAEPRYGGEIIYDSEGNVLYGKQFG